MKKQFLILTIALLVISSSAAASLFGYFWYGGISHYDYSNVNRSDVELFWSHNDMDDISEWKFCWRRKSNTSNGKNPCDYNSMIVDEPTATVNVMWGITFKFQVEGYHTKKRKWIVYSPTISRPCFQAEAPGMSIQTNCKDI